ncbi:MAG: hypothetical protein PUB18_02625, partial [bacterium]|nr:hypothetical protein [bacterium]
MTDMWNNTCVLISDMGDVILSGLMTTRHNDAIRECASKLGLDISAEQSMTDMLHVLTTNNHVVLLNCGKILDENGLKKRSGYLALPSSFSKKQLDQIENLKLLLEEYQ